VTVVRYLKAPNGVHHLICQGEQRFRTLDYLTGLPFLAARFDLIPDQVTTDANVVATLAYFLGWISGAILLVTERQNRFVRFHALQSVIVFGILSLAWFLFLSIPLLGWLISFILIPPVSAIVWLLLMFKAYQGERFKLPIVGDIAEQRS